MVGAKEFAMNRKVIQAKKKNPLLEKITLPASMRAHDKALDSLSNSLLDKLNSSPIVRSNIVRQKQETTAKYPKLAKQWDARGENPILRDFRAFKSRMDDEESTETEKDEKEEARESGVMSDEIVNRLTYKIFNKIKKYLDSDVKKPTATNNSGKHIKVEISI